MCQQSQACMLSGVVRVQSVTESAAAGDGDDAVDKAARWAGSKCNLLLIPLCMPTGSMSVCQAVFR